MLAEGYLFSSKASTVSSTKGQNSLNLKTAFKHASSASLSGASKNVDRGISATSDRALDDTQHASNSSSAPINKQAQVLKRVWATSPLSALLEGHAFDSEHSDNLLTALQDLFLQISSQKKRLGVIAPKQFITKLKAENGE